MAHNKAGGSSRRRPRFAIQASRSQRYGGQLVSAGEIIVAPAGHPVHPGANVGRAATIPCSPR